MGDAVGRNGDPGHDQMLAHVWRLLTRLLEAHTLAEEELCYLPMFGCSPEGAPGRRKAVEEHDAIREAITEASLQRVESAAWWRAVRAVQAACAEHLDHEERDLLPYCLTGLTAGRRRELGRQWSVFVAAWTMDAEPETGAATPDGPPFAGQYWPRAQM